MCREDWGIAEADPRDVPCLDSILLRTPPEAGSGDAHSSGGGGASTHPSMLGGGAGTVCSRAMLASLVATTAGGRHGVGSRAAPASPGATSGDSKVHRGGGSADTALTTRAARISPWRGIYRDRIQARLAVYLRLKIYRRSFRGPRPCTKGTLEKCPMSPPTLLVHRGGAWSDPWEGKV